VRDAVVLWAFFTASARAGSTISINAPKGQPRLKGHISRPLHEGLTFARNAGTTACPQSWSLKAAENDSGHRKVQDSSPKPESEDQAMADATLRHGHALLEEIHNDMPVAVRTG